MNIFLTLENLKEVALSTLEKKTLTNIEEPINKIISATQLLEVKEHLKEIKRISDPKCTNLLIQLSQHEFNIAMTVENTQQVFGLTTSGFPSNGWEF